MGVEMATRMRRSTGREGACNTNAPALRRGIHLNPDLLHDDAFMLNVGAVGHGCR